MSSNTQKIVLSVIGLIVAYFAIKWILTLAIGALLGILPVVIIAGVLYGGYLFFGKKALRGGRRTLP